MAQAATSTVVEHEGVSYVHHCCGVSFVAARTNCSATTKHTDTQNTSPKRRIRQFSRAKPATHIHLHAAFAHKFKKMPPALAHNVCMCC